MSTNSGVWSGNLVRDGELKYSPAGGAYLKFTIGVFNKMVDGKAESFFPDVTVFGAAAEKAADNAVKGALAYVSGRIGIDTWVTQQGENAGQKQMKVTITAFNVDFPKAGPASQPQRQEQASRPQQRQAPARPARRLPDPDLDPDGDDCPF